MHHVLRLAAADITALGLCTALLSSTCLRIVFRCSCLRFACQPCKVGSRVHLNSNFSFALCQYDGQYYQYPVRPNWRRMQCCEMYGTSLMTSCTMTRVPYPLPVSGDLCMDWNNAGFLLDSKRREKASSAPSREVKSSLHSRDHK